MIGGGAGNGQHLDPISRALAPGVAAAPRTPQALSVFGSRACYDAGGFPRNRRTPCKRWC
jgi:hypothetical protein